MQRARPYKGYTIRALDGDAGSLAHCLFDDETWSVKFLVVDTGSWLFASRVVIAPSDVDYVDWHGKRLVVALTRHQIERSPDADTRRPVSRQRVDARFVSYRIPPVAAGGGLWAPGPYLSEPELGRPESGWEDDPHLRSTDDITGYRIEAIDGRVGRVAGFGVDDEAWAIRYLVVETGRWWQRRRVLVEPQRVDRISWTKRSVFVGLTKHAVESAPHFDASCRVSSGDVARLAAHVDDVANWRIRSKF